MTYDSRETSAADGRPIEIFTFARGPIVWRYTSADEQQTVETQVYPPAVISRPPVKQGTEIARSVMSLRVPNNLAVLDQYRVVPPSDEVTLVIRQFHYGDSGIATIWTGVVIGVVFDEGEATIHAEPRSNGARSMGLRRCYQRQCPFVLYGPECGLNSGDFRTLGTATGISGVVITVPAADTPADGYFNGGWIEWLIAPGTYERRFIETHVGAAITVSAQPVGLEIGGAVRLYPGCDHKIDTCNSKFSNALNFGGQPYTPLKNPFGSDPVY